MTSKAEYEGIHHQSKKASKALTSAWNNLDHFNPSSTDREIANAINEAQGTLLRIQVLALKAKEA